MFSIVMPMDTGRIEQFTHTKQAYDEMREKREFLIPTRSAEELQEALEKRELMKDVRLIPYVFEGESFNPAMALNIGCREAQYDRIVITCPEVRPTTKVLTQMAASPGENIVCQVFDQDEDRGIGMSLVNTGFRGDSPGMYFLAVFNKEDLLAVNGWDEAFMGGYAWEDTDFGMRWNRAALPFTVRDDILALHQWHPRPLGGGADWDVNAALHQANNQACVVKPQRGIVTL